MRGSNPCSYVDQVYSGEDQGKQQWKLERMLEQSYLLVFPYSQHLFKNKHLILFYSVSVFELYVLGLFLNIL